MDATLKLWVVIVVVGALNFMSRLSFIAFFARRHVPPPLARALKYVPAAMLTALIVPMIVPAGPLSVAWITAPKVVAALIAGVAAFATRNTLLTLGVGMGTLWVAEAVAARLG